MDNTINIEATTLANWLNALDGAMAINQECLKDTPVSKHPDPKRLIRLRLQSALAKREMKKILELLK